jgi:hypothetical protein
MQIYKILQVVAGFLFLLSSLTHAIFIFADFRCALWFYCIFDDPGEYKGVETVTAGELGAMIVLVLSILHGVCYFIIAVILLLFKKNRIIPGISIILTLTGIFLGIRIFVTFGYTSAILVFHLIIDLIVLAISVYTWKSLQISYIIYYSRE